ncbi:hypothetical protein [Allokutzneria multivorans]|uniref:hypothetical protein n=1 Tax=Allokutzneria multivorans TaxID=1142134 RepID=UPI0031EE4151
MTDVSSARLVEALRASPVENERLREAADRAECPTVLCVPTVLALSDHQCAEFAAALTGGQAVDVLSLPGFGPVVLLDTRPALAATTPGFRAAVLRETAARAEGFDDLDRRLTVTGRYLDLFANWKPSAVTAATLVVEAGRAMADEPSLAWPSPHELVAATGDHFTVLEDGAGATAEAVHDWLEGRFR